MDRHLGLLLATAFAAGLALSAALPPRFAPAALALPGILLAVAALIAIRLRPPARPRSPAAPAVSRAMLFLFLGILRAPAPAPPAAAPGERAPVVVEGTVDEPPVTASEEVRGARETMTLFGLVPDRGPRVRVLVPGLAPQVLGGRRVRVTGTLFPTHGARNPGDSGLSGPRLLAAPHPLAITLLAPGIEPSFAGLAGALRGRILSTLVAIYPERTRGFIASMLLGDRRLLPHDVRDALLLTGTFHLLAISGLHVVLVMALVLRVPIPPRVRVAFRLAVLAAFTLLTGASPPVLRAACMFAVEALVESAGRKGRSLNTLGWTALLLLGLDPLLLADLGFQLSFVSVFFILTWSARLTANASLLLALDRRPRRTGTPLGLAARAAARSFVASVAVSVAAAAGTAPLTLLHFQRVHPLGPVWNLLAYPLTLIPLAGGFASLVLGSLHPKLGQPVAWLVDSASSLLLAPLLAGAHCPGSAVFVPRPHGALALAAYALLAAGLVPRWRRAVLITGLAACPAAVLAARLIPQLPEAWTFAVGAGDAALLRVPGAGSFLIDAGAPGTDREAAANLARATLSSGTRALAGVFITHAHADHLRGFRGLPRRLPVAGLWTAPGCEASAAGAGVIAEARAAGVPRREAAAGHCLRFPGAPGFSIDVIHPLADESLPLARSANDSSLALRVALDGRAFLFLGDLEEDGVARLFSCRRELTADVLVAPHHGRPNRLWPLLLERVRPRAVIISGNGEGGARELAAATEAAGIPVFATFQGGAVRTAWNAEQGWTPGYWRAARAEKK